MKPCSIFEEIKYILCLSILLSLLGCSKARMRQVYNLNSIISTSSISYREPALGSQWLATLVDHDGREKIELIDLRKRRIVSLPGLNRGDSQPISVSVSSNGEKLAFIRQRAGQTELLIYRRNLGTLQTLPISPRGVPRRVSLDALGRVLAVQVSRDGRWEVDLIRLSS